MFGIDYSEALIIAIVALVVIGPKDLPRVMRQVGQWVGKARATARHFRSGIDTMMREAELEEMNTRWAEQNAAIMSGTPAVDEEPTDVLASQVRLQPDTPSPAQAAPESPLPQAGEGKKRRTPKTTPLPLAGEATRASARAGEGVPHAPTRADSPRKPRKRVAPTP